jgi:hypothetical protein
MGGIAEGLLAHRRVLAAPTSPAKRLLAQVTRPEGIPRPLPRFPGMLSEPPGADPHAGWCGRGQGKPGLYPILCGGRAEPQRRRPVPTATVGDPRGRSEALTEGVRAGLLSRETTLIPGCRRRPHGGRRDCWRRYSRVVGGPCAVRDPRHVRQAPCTRTERSRGRPLVVGDAPSGMVRGVADQRRAGREGNA